MQWQIKRGSYVAYYKPEEVCLIMNNCKLRNHRATAEKIHAGENKTVCAWIECDEVCVGSSNGSVDFFGLDKMFPIRYNPRVAPNWTNQDGLDVDNKQYETIYSKGKGLVYG